MEKKVVTFVLLLFLCGSVLPAGETRLGGYGTSIDKSIIFEGFPFKSYDPSKNTGIEPIVQAEIDKIAGMNIGDYAIVGHSQGGLRALAYATMLERLAKTNPKKYASSYNHLKAIVTVSGIDKGLLALENNASTFKSKLNQDIDILWNGVSGLVKSSIALEMLYFEAASAYVTYETFLSVVTGKKSPSLITRNTIEETLLSYVPEPFKTYISSGLRDSTLNSVSEVRDMCPGSNFIKKNVSDTQKVTYRKQVDTKVTTTIKWKKVGILKVPCIEIKITPVYATYTKYVDSPKFSNNIPVAYIIGLQNDTLGTMETELPGLKKKVQSIASTAAGFMKAGQVLNVLKCCSITGLFNGNVKYASDCSKAATWLNNVQGEINELLGSSQNDGLVAKESQFYSRYFTVDDVDSPNKKKTIEIHSNVLSETNNGVIEYAEYNHATIAPTTNKTIKLKINNLLASF